MDIKIFEFNKELRYLDLFYNRLKIVIWYLLVGFRYLDFFFNDFDIMFIFEEIGNMLYLEILGLSGVKI